MYMKLILFYIDIFMKHYIIKLQQSKKYGSGIKIDM